MPGIRVGRTTIGLGQRGSSYWTTPILTSVVVSGTAVNLAWIGKEAASIERSTDGFNFSEIDVVNKGTYVYSDTGLTTGLTYYYRVREIKGANYSEYSNRVYAGTNSFYTALNGRWKLKEVNANITPNAITGGNNGIVTGAVPAVVNKREGLVFNGSSDFISIDLAITNPFSLSMWGIPTHIAVGESVISSAGNTNWFLQIGASPNFPWQVNGAYNNTYKPVLNKTDFLTFTYTGTTLSLYVNAILAGSVTVTLDLSGTSMVISKRGDNYAYFKGMIRDVSYYTRALAIADMKKLMLNGGVWKPQGTVLKGDIAYENGEALEPTVIYEGSPQILSGNVFKMWYSASYPDYTLSYAESKDGITWVKYSGNPILAGNHCRSFLIKVNSVYYLYATRADDAIDLYTSSDGVNFSVHTLNVLVKGTGAEWDSLHIGNSCTIIDNGVWYMFYDGVKTGVLIWQTGLATSNDGVTWTKYGAVPIISELFQVSGAYVVKVGNSFYLWGHGGYTTSLPTDMHYRYKSSDLITWVKDTDSFTYARLTADEGVGVNIGQVADPCLIEVNGKVYMFYDACSDGNTLSGVPHIGLAIANMPFTDLVLTQEGYDL